MELNLWKEKLKKKGDKIPKKIQKKMKLNLKKYEKGDQIPKKKEKMKKVEKGKEI